MIRRREAPGRVRPRSRHCGSGGGRFRGAPPGVGGRSKARAQAQTLSTGLLPGPRDRSFPGMPQPPFRTLADLEDAALASLADADGVRRAWATLAVEGDDLLCIEIRPGGDAGHARVCLMGGYPVRARAVDLVLRIHGAAPAAPPDGMSR